MRYTLTLPLAALATVTGAPEAVAQQAASRNFDPERFALCENKDRKAPVDVVIGGCTALLQSGKAQGNMISAILMERARAYFGKEDYEAAIRDLDQALQQDALSPAWRADMLTMRGAAHNIMKRTDRALEDYSAALAAKPDHAVTHLSRGWIHLEIKEAEAALRDFERAAAEGDLARAQQASALHGQAIALQNLGKSELALRKYGESLTMNSSSPSAMEVYRNRARLLQKAGKRAEARADYDAAITLAGKEAAAKAELHVLKAGTFIDEEDHKAAKAEYEKAIATKGDYAAGHRGRGYAMAGLGDFHGAIAAYAKALELEPDHAFTLANLAFALNEIGWHEQSLGRIDRAVALAPDNAEYRNSACWTRAAHLNRELAKAREHCDAAIRLAPKEANYFDSRGMANLRDQRFEAAWNDYDAAVRLASDFASALYGRGIAALRLGRQAEAEGDLARALRIDPKIVAEYAARGFCPAVAGGMKGEAGAILAQTPLGTVPATCAKGAGE